MSTGTEALGPQSRGCDVCGQVDTGPRHITATVSGENLAPDTCRHFACCARAGCPDGSCNVIMAEAQGGST